MQGTIISTVFCHLRFGWANEKVKMFACNSEGTELFQYSVFQKLGVYLILGHAVCEKTVYEICQVFRY